MKSCRRTLAGALVLVAVALSFHAASAHEPGIRTLTATVPERGGTIDLTLWYPAHADGVSESVGGSKIFKGVPGRRNASHADGVFPVVLLAAGGLRANPNMAGWIAAYLAARGYLVATAHPPALGSDDAQSAVGEVWLRPADLSAALNAVENDPGAASHVEPNKVAALGFFLGGTSSLALAGARLDAESYKRSCDGPETSPDCRWFAKNGVDLDAIDNGKIAASHHDSRINVAIAVNPELSGSFAPDSLSEIEIPIQVINLGQSHSIPPGLDASVLAKAIPGVRYEAITDATPFSAFSECTPQAAVLLAEEGEDEIICSDGGSRSRADIHAQLGRMIEATLAQGFSGQP